MGVHPRLCPGPEPRSTQGPRTRRLALGAPAHLALGRPWTGRYWTPAPWSSRRSLISHRLLTLPILEPQEERKAGVSFGEQ